MKIQDLRRLAVPALLIIALVFAWMGTESSPMRQYSLDASAQRYVDDGLKRALVTFATARTLNAALSVAQGTQLSAQPLGVGVQVGLGQLLHPINEMIGQFADLMLVACMAFGAMEILVRVGSHWAATLALTIAAAACAGYRWRGAAVPGWLWKLLLLLAVIRFAIPAIAIGSEALYKAFMADEYQASQQAISLSSDRIGTEPPARSDRTPARKEACRLLPDWLCKPAEVAPGAELGSDPKAESSLVDRLTRLASADVAGGLANLQKMAESMTENVVKLMVVFLLQTLIIPLVLGWALLRGVGTLLRVRSRTGP